MDTPIICKWCGQPIDEGTMVPPMPCEENGEHPQINK